MDQRASKVSEDLGPMDRRTGIEQRVEQHYAQSGLEERILSALAAAGKDVERLTASDLAPVDEFHTGGRAATIEIAAQAGFGPGMHVLDIGCGIGGASRFFAQERGCCVTGIDITADYIRVAQALAKRVGLERRVAYQRASALSLPFKLGTFDGAYMMHVGMNIKDKPTLFAEARRVLKNGAVLAIYDVVLTGRGDVSYPLPCALSPDTCFMLDVAGYQRELDAAGFDILTVHDRLDVARAFFRQEQARAAGGAAPSPLGIHILMKEDAPRIFSNVVSLFERGILSPTEFIARTR
jgi:SAM-dependent methyltransferase